MPSIKINIDSQGYTQKPNNYETNCITKRIRTSHPVEVQLEEFCDLISKGHTFISGCVIDPKANTLRADNTHNFAFFGLDIDNKEHQITPKAMIDEVNAKLGILPAIYYDTFSSTSANRKFRLIYIFETPIDLERFKMMYKRLKILFPLQIDNSTSNPNRLWFATNKPQTVRYNDKYTPLGERFFEHLERIVPIDVSGQGISRKDHINYSDCNLLGFENFYNCLWFKNEKRNEIAQYVIDHVSIADYVALMGADLKDNGDYYTCACPFHGGDNPTAFVIYKHSKSAFCFSKQCVAGDVINLCKVFENKSYFDAVKTLMCRFQLNVPMKFVDDQKLYQLIKGVENND